MASISNFLPRIDGAPIPAVLAFHCDCARLVLPFYETRCPQNTIPRQAVDAVSAFLSGTGDAATVGALYDPPSSDDGGWGWETLHSYTHPAAQYALMAITDLLILQRTQTYPSGFTAHATASAFRCAVEAASHHERLELLLRLGGFDSIEGWMASRLDQRIDAHRRTGQPTALAIAPILAFV